MTIDHLPRPKMLLLAGAATLTLVPFCAQARPIGQASRPAAYSIGAQDLGAALTQLARDSGRNIVFAADLVQGKRTVGYRGQGSVEQALGTLLKGSGLSYRVSGSGTYLVTAATARPAGPSQDAPETSRRRPAAAALPAHVDVQEIQPSDIIVTARRMQEKIIDVPIAVSAFSGSRLAELKIEGGPELLRAIPNVNFSKDNYTGYNFEIRGVGTKALSTTADPAVAIDFNNQTLIRNRLFEQEYLDVQRVEVLRGPQGTLYGRNATAGVVNMLPNLPELGKLSGESEVEAGNYDTLRSRGYLNVPIGDKLAVRVAAAFTKRDGFDYNTETNEHVNGRDLYSIRSSILWQPTDRFQASAIWEHFNEDDDRSRTGKQLCTRGGAPSSINWTDPDGGQHVSAVTTQWTSAALTQGCQNASLYSDNAYGVPNGRAFPVVIGLILATPFTGGSNAIDGNYLTQANIDPFATPGNKQSSNLRDIATFYDPKFQANNDVFQFNMNFNVNSDLTLYSQYLYTRDYYYSTQDFFRFDTTPGMFASKDTIDPATGKPRVVNANWVPYLGVDANGYGTFIDPQLGELNRLAAVDLSEAKSEQFSQELRLTSSFDGPFNFNFGANYLKYNTTENYYIFSNAFTIMALAENQANNWNVNCTKFTGRGTGDPNACLHIDPNPISSLDNQGHNYYRSLQISQTESWSVFGEGYFDLAKALRLTAGLRFTRDTKTETPVPTQLLAGNSAYGGGYVGIGYPEDPNIVQNFSAPTGRVALDWKPRVSFTDDTLIYASYSRGYKAGGNNPIGADANSAVSDYPLLPTTFKPEYVNTFEVGMKNVLDHGKLMLNITGFYNDYHDYQVTQLIDRMNHTENFNAKTYGVEFETAWQPTHHFRLDGTMGLLKTRINDGETSIDVMDRLQGHTDYSVVSPWPNSPATCVVPNAILGRYITTVDSNDTSGVGQAFVKILCPGPDIFANGFLPGSSWSKLWGDKWGPLVYDPVTDGPNQGRGFAADLSGHELPNAPKVTFNIGAQQSFDLPHGWAATVRGDLYHQSESFARVYNDAVDRLKGYEYANLTLSFDNKESGLGVQLYVKNVTNATPITDAYTGPDELGNFSNVFTLDPRTFGAIFKSRF